MNDKLNIKRSIKNIRSLLKDHKLLFVLTMTCALISVICSVIVPILIGDALNIIIEGYSLIVNHTGTIDYAALVYTLTVATILYIISNCLLYIQTYYLSKIATDVASTLRIKMNKKVLNLPMASVDEKQRGKIVLLQTNIIDTLEYGLSTGLVTISTTVNKIIVTIIVMLLINVWMTLAIILIVIGSFLLTKILSIYSQEYFYKENDSHTKTTEQIEEMFTSQEIICSFNNEEKVIKEFDTNVNEWYTHRWKSSFLSNLNKPITRLTSNLGYVLIAILGAFLAIQGSISIGRIVTFMEYLSNYTDSIETITKINKILHEGLAATQRVFDFLELEEEENHSTKKLKEFNDKITFENVSFGYNEDKKVIDNFSLTIKKGEKIAIIGETGTGKTTILKLLTRLYDVDSGAIKIDDTNINKYDKNSLRSYMSIVPQESWLFSDSIKENIRYGKLESTDEEIITASKHANTDEFIRQLPMGYKTKLNADGYNLSQGQKQLLTIARAIISDKNILILDEATSNLDTMTEKLIQKSMNRLMKNKTSLIVAHRLSTIKNADNIIVLGKGRVIEQGNHEELLEKKGYYYKTLNNQIKNYNL